MTCETSSLDRGDTVTERRPVGYWVDQFGPPPWTTVRAEEVGDAFRGELSLVLRSNPVQAVKRATDELAMAPDVWPLIQLTRDLGKIVAESTNSAEDRAAAAGHLHSASRRVLDTAPRDESDAKLFFAEARWLERIAARLAALD